MKKSFYSRILSIILLAVLPFSFLAGHESSASAEAPVTLTFMYPGIAQADQGKVLTEINRLLIQKMNVKLSLIPVNWGDYEQKMRLMLAAGEPIDLLFTAPWQSHYFTFADKGLFYPMDDLLDNYAPQLEASIPAAYLKGAAINGRLYALPVQSNASTWKGVLLNKRLVDKYKIDVRKLKTLADLDPVLKRIKTKEKYSLPLFGKGDDFLSFAVQERIDDTPGSLMPGYGTKIVNEFQTKDMKKVLTLQYNWFHNGYLKKQLKNADFIDLPEAVQKSTFAVLKGTMDSNSASETASTTGLPWVEVRLDSPRIMTADVTSAMTAVPVTSKHPDKAMELLQLLYKDKELLNLLDYGIEGQHYKKIAGSANKIRLMGTGYDPYLSWEIGNPSIALQEADLGASDPVVRKRIFDKAKPSPLLGFVYRPSAQVQYFNVVSVVNDFAQSLNTSPSEPNKALINLQARLKKAGVDLLLKDKQKQAASFLSKK